MTTSKPISLSKILLIIAVLSLLIPPGCGPTGVDPEPHRHEQPSEYYLYFPKDYKENSNVPVFVGIHGQGGSGRDCWSTWQPYADQEGFVLVCPSLADENGGWYQDQGEAKVSSILNDIIKNHKVNRRFYLAGFSAGAQFVQGFAYRYGNNVAGAAVLSAGNYYQPDPSARNVYFLVVIGDRDNASAVEAATAYSSFLKSNKYRVKSHLLEGVGHTLTDRAREITIEHFRAVMK